MFRMLKSKSWFGQTSTTPKNVHSPEYLKYLYSVLSKNSVVSESNKSLLVETLRSIAEILIWGDQNDSTVFDFFLEKNMLSYFLKIMKQKCGSYVCVQLLQTLNILFENIRNETSLYYLLSNNHVNSIIEHKFDFSDEEVMAYYISFLKTLSFKLNSHTIHFFYNEHTNDFPLYTEAIKFFNNSESMVRIAVRTLTLNVYRVDDKSMLKFIRDKTAAPYFSNLVWFIGNNVQDIDAKIRTIQLVNVDRQSSSRLEDLVAEHLDHLHYVNDILLLGIVDLNEVLTDHLLNRLFIPIHLSPFTPNKDLSLVLGLFLLSQVFVIVTNEDLLRMLRDNLVKYETPIVEAIDCAENDYVTLYALTLINGLSRTLGKDERPFPDIKRKIIQVIQASVKFDTKVRLVTLSLACGMLLDATEQELSLVDSCREENVNNLLNYFKTEEMFLEIFEDEFNAMKSYDLDHLLRDSVLLLPPVGSPLSFVHIDKRRPCGEGERCRRSLRVYFVLRALSLRLRGETEKQLPLMQGHPSVQLEQNLDLTNSDLLAVTVIPPLGQKYRRFLVVDSFQLILVDPSQKRMGWGIAKFVGFLQELEVVGDSSDSRCLHVTVKGLSAKFMFDDHIRCMAARQRLLKGRAKARERKLAVIGRLLNDLTNQVPENLNCKKKKYLPGAVQPFST